MSARTTTKSEAPDASQSAEGAAPARTPPQIAGEFGERRLCLVDLPKRFIAVLRAHSRDLTVDLVDRLLRVQNGKLEVVVGDLELQQALFEHDGLAREREAFVAQGVDAIELRLRQSDLTVEESLLLPGQFELGLLDDFVFGEGRELRGEQFAVSVVNELFVAQRVGDRPGVAMGFEFPRKRYRLQI